jgi:hypothetical protein
VIPRAIATDHEVLELVAGNRWNWLLVTNGTGGWLLVRPGAERSSRSSVTNAQFFLLPMTRSFVTEKTNSVFEGFCNGCQLTVSYLD